jgi:hypothetical protein
MLPSRKLCSNQGELAPYPDRAVIPDKGSRSLR